MKNAPLKNLTLILFLFMSFQTISYGQCEPSEISADEVAMKIVQNDGDNSFKFSLEDIAYEDDDLIIWFFGDGHYATGPNPTHTYKEDITYNVSAYLSKRYVPDPPSIFKGVKDVDGHVGNNNTNYGLPGENLGGIEVSLNTSWNVVPIDNNFHYFILKLKNRTNQNFSGSVELSSESAIHFETGDCLLPADINSPQTIDEISVNQQTISFELEPNETKQFYIQADIEPGFNFHAQPDIETIAILYSSHKTDPVGATTLKSNITLHPHDPNSILVLQDQVCPMVDVPQVLDKIVHFQNVGHNFVDSVNVWLLEGSIHETYSLEILDSSHEISDIDTVGNYYKIFFHDIKLPGLDQNSPRQFAPSETSGWVHYQVTIDPCVENKQIIYSEAIIQFVGVGGIRTNRYETIANSRKCEDLPLCDDNDDDDDDDEEEKEKRNVDVDVEGNSELIQAYPNPFQNYLEINIPNKTDSYSIEVYDLKGSKVYTEEGGSEHSGKHLINSDSWQDGLYLIQIHQAQESRLIKCLKQ